LVLFFCSSEYDLEAMADEMRLLFSGIQLVGCTTAGEFGSAGYLERSLTGASFSKGDFSVVSGLLENLRDFDALRGHEFSQSLLQHLENKAPQADQSNSFALLLIDGMSIREEPVVHALQASIGQIPLLGGSAGDDGRFERTWVFHEGRFHTDSAVLLLASTSLPIKLFMNQHFVASDERMVVTEADTATRTVKEINGLPAAEEYARLLGVPVSELASVHYASTPVVVLIDGVSYVRSIQKANPDGSLKFYCAIEEGVVFRLARGQDMLATLQDAFSAIRDEIGRPQIVIGCDCIQRKEEIAHTGLLPSVAALFGSNNVIGFNSYGEQFHGIHVNQTFTAIAIGERADND
jgi:hypothetical protein